MHERETLLQRNENPWKMKKYMKLLLSVVALVSLVCFIFYKHKYDRLYNVMEVLEIFGTPEDPNFKCPSTGSGHPPLLGQVTSWQRVTDDLSVYSAYCDTTPADTQGCAIITSLAIARQEPTDFKCKLWYEGSFHAIEGVFSQQTLSSGGEVEVSDYNPVTITCENKFPSKIPYGVTFYKDKGSPQSQVPVSVPATSLPSPFLLCLLPQDSPLDSTREATENILFHSFLGVRNFIIYSSGLSTSFFVTLNKLIQELGVHASVVPWNVPHPLPTSHMTDLVTRDCFYKSRKISDNWSILGLSQVIVPKMSPNLTHLIDSMTSHRLLTDGINHVRIKRFCSEYPNDPKAQNMIHSISLLESTTYNKELSKDLEVSLYHHDAKVKNYSVGLSAISEYVSIHDYSACDSNDFDAKDQSAAYDATSLRFADDFQAFYEKYKQ